MSRMNRSQRLQRQSRCHIANRHDRPLRLEPLEDRRMLATFSVNNLSDGPVAMAGDLPGSLRQAIYDANNTVGADDIDLTGVSGTLLITSGEFTITEDLTVTGPGATHLAISAQQLSRIFNITAATGDYSIVGFTMTGGLTIGNDEGGGAIRSNTAGTLTIERSNVTSNQTNGNLSRGGGIYSTGHVTLLDSTVSNNYTTGFASSGGGVSSLGDITIVQSTISGNEVLGVNNQGGGVFSIGESVTISHSTITDNHVDTIASSGGGIVGAIPLNISHSIVFGNTAGAEVRDSDISLPGAASISANYNIFSTAGLTSDNLQDINAGVGNQLNTDPLLGPLSDNGGPTQTHALLPNSPAIDAGDMSILFNPAEFDQRGPNFFRVMDAYCVAPAGVIDIGAYEAQTAPSADFVDDDIITGLDFLAWQRGFGTTSGAVRADGNSDDDGDVDGSDLAAWELTYGQVDTTPLVAAVAGGEASSVAVQASASQAAHSPSAAKLADLALAMELASDTSKQAKPPLEDQSVSVEVPIDNTFTNQGPAPQSAASTAGDLFDASSEDNDEPDEQWLSDELLEQVFGWA